MADFALFLPFSCNERRQRPASLSKAEPLEVIEKTERTGVYGWFANACISLQNRPSQGSGPGGRWFESTRPDHYIFNNLHINALRRSGRQQLRAMREKAREATIILTAIFPYNENLAVMPTIQPDQRPAGKADGWKARPVPECERPASGPERVPFEGI